MSLTLKPLAATLTATAGPNGSEDWLNCGINGAGWTPPYVTVADLKTVDLAEAVKSASSPFRFCTKFIDTFYKYGEANGRECPLATGFVQCRC
jgi:hypothetical protein